MTGQDSRALSAFAHLIDLYACSDEQGRACAIVAMRACLAAVQEKVWPLFQKAIPHGLDWSDEITLWAKLAPGDAADKLRDKDHETCPHVSVACRSKNCPVHRPEGAAS